MKKLYTSIVLTLLLLAFAIPASAITLSFVPQNQTRLLGETAIVDVVVGGLTGNPGEIVSAFDLSLLYDQTIVQANALNLSAVDLMGGISDTLFDVDFNPGRIDFNVTSFLTDDNDIAALQAGNNDPLTLARIFFDTVGLGTSPLSFDFTSPTKVIVGRDAMELPISSQNGSITVTNGQVQVPEPSPFLLFMLGVLALAVTGNSKLRFLA
jgi:hypothetical protein